MKALTELDKRKIRQSFAAASVSYDGFAELQRRAALELLGRLDVEAVCGTLLDVGCGTGFLTHHLQKRFESDTLLAMDIALPMLEQARIRTPAASYFCADAEQMPLLRGSLAMITSNLALQWCEALAEAFVDYHALLRADGKLAFSTFGPGTLRELKDAWALVDDYSHINTFYSLKQIVGFLEMAGFCNIETESVLYRNRYDSVMALMRELKGIGAHNVTARRNRRLTTRSQLQQMIAGYPIDEAGDIVASYEIIYVTAEKT